MSTAPACRAAPLGLGPSSLRASRLLSGVVTGPGGCACAPVPWALAPSHSAPERAGTRFGWLHWSRSRRGSASQGTRRVSQRGSLALCRPCLLLPPQMWPLCYWTRATQQDWNSKSQDITWRAQKGASLLSGIATVSHETCDKRHGDRRHGWTLGWRGLCQEGQSGVSSLLPVLWFVRG